MAMYIMNGQTFLKKYVNEDPEIVMKTQFVIVSSSIRKGGRYEQQVINGNAALYPSERLIVDTKDYKSKAFENEYFEQLEDNLPFLAVLIRAVVLEDYTIVFLCGKKEWKRQYLKLIAKFVKEKFGFPIYDYKKVKDGDQEAEEYDAAKVLKLVDKLLEDAKIEKEDKALSSADRLKYLKTLSKKELRKKLKKLDIDSSDMSRSEMIETLDLYL